jgi:hypothetical protein
MQKLLVITVSKISFHTMEVDLLGISKEEYKKALKAEGVITESSSAFLNELFHSNGRRLSAPELSEALGHSPITSPANAIIGRLGRKIAEQLNLEPPLRNDRSPGWYQYIADDTEEKGHKWILKEALAEALIELGLV